MFSFQNLTLTKLSQQISRSNFFFCWIRIWINNFNQDPHLLDFYLVRPNNRGWVWWGCRASRPPAEQGEEFLESAEQKKFDHFGSLTKNIRVGIWLFVFFGVNRSFFERERAIHSFKRAIPSFTKSVKSD